MKRIYVLLVALAIAAVAVSAAEYTRATGGKVLVNGKAVQGSNSPMPTVKMSAWDFEKGYLIVKGEFAGYEVLNSAESKAGRGVGLNLNIWKEDGKMRAAGWYWSQGKAPVFVAFDNLKSSMGSGKVSVSASNGLLSFSVKDMNVGDITFFRPMKHF